MLFIAMTAVLAAQPAKELKLACPGLNISGLDASVAGPLTDHLAQQFDGVRVVTPRDISALLGLERQKQILGCADTAASCMAELGNALGVQGVVLGDVVKLGKAVQVNLRIIDPVDGKSLARASERVSSEDEIFEALTRAAHSLRQQFLTAMGAPASSAIAPPTAEAVSASSGGGGTRRFSPIPLAVGGAAVAVGAVLMGISNGVYVRLTTGNPGSITAAEAPGLAQSGRTFQTVGVVMIAVGAVAVASGAALFFLGSRGDSQPTAALGLAPNGVVFAGTF